MLASDVIALARDHGIDFDVVFTEDVEMFRDLTKIVRDLIEQIIQVAPLGYTLPLDDRQQIDVTTYQVQYPLPMGHWRIRGARAIYAGTPQQRPIQIVSPDLEANVPAVQPSAFIDHGGFHPIDHAYDGLVLSRRFGWFDVSTVEIIGVLEPSPITAAGNTLELPDDAGRAVAYELTMFLAKRGRYPDSVRAQLLADAKGAKEALFFAIRNFPGPAPHPLR